MIVIVNAGHCIGKDSGAVGQYSQEANLCYDVGQRLCQILDDSGHSSVFIQEDELQDICDLANDYGDEALFISIHCNACESHEAQGTETFYYEYADESYMLAECVQEELVEALQSVDRGLKDGSWLYVLKHTDMPAILTELGFIDNPEDEDMLNGNIAEIAQALSRGILKYIKEVNNE